jgi:hypothetical protein
VASFETREDGISAKKMADLHIFFAKMKLMSFLALIVGKAFFSF